MRPGPGERTYRRLLLLWPADFRHDHEAEAVAHFAAERAEAAASLGRLAMPKFWARMIIDVLVTAIAVRWPSPRLAPAPASGAGRPDAASRARWRRLDALRLDLRHGARTIARAPAFAASVVLTLALGIGATTAVFTLVDAMLVRPLPFAQPERLIELQRRMPGGFSLPFFPSAFGHRLAEEATEEGVVLVGAHERLTMVLGSADEPRDVRVHAATPSLFDLLGRSPLLGRSILETDAHPGAPPVAVLTHGTWRSLGSDPALVGKIIELDGSPFTIVGVMPSDFRFPKSFSAEVFIAMDEGGQAAGLELGRIQLIARLSDGATLEVARERLADLAGFLREELAVTGEWEAAVVPMADHRANPDVSRALWLAAGAVALMFLIAVVNGLNLLLARLVARGRELAVRASLGATRGRLLRQILVESLLLALLGGLVAVTMAAAGIGLLMRVAPTELTLQAPNGIVVDDRVLGFAFLVTVLAGFICALVPGLMSLRWARSGTALTLRSGGATSQEHARLRSGLVIAQVALALTLMVGAGLLITSFARLLAVPPGFDTRRLVLLEINPNDRAYATAERRAAFGGEVERRLRALPGVQAVTRADALPPRAGFRVQPVLQAHGDPEPRPDAPFILPWGRVRPDYLPTLGTRIVAGRNFEPGEGADSDVAIIDRDLARFFWDDQQPIGRRFRMSESGPWLTVVGLIDDLMLGMPDGSYGEHIVLRPASVTHDGTYFAVRAAGDPGPLVAAIRDVVREVDAYQPIYSLSTARQAILEELSKQRFFLIVVGVLAAIALALTAIGIYGLLSFVVQRRSREIGIRIALGAHARAVLGQVVGGGMKLVAAGVVLGLAGALVVGRFMRSIIFGIEPTDPATLIVVTALLACVAVVACLVPAGRAARVDPIAVLKAE